MCNKFYAQSCTVSAVAKDVQGNENVTIDCAYPLTNNKTCLNLTAEYSKIYSATSYSVSAETYAPMIPYNQGTPLNANFDDVFSQQIVMPFNFCFYGNGFNLLSIGSNGIVTFENQAGNINYPNIQADVPSPLLPKNSIYGVYQDLVFSNTDDSEIYYSTIGNAPCRKFVINFYKGKLAGCDTRISSQIVLHEGTNEIEVFVEDKPLPCTTAKFKESLIGIMNGTGTVGTVPPGRNTGVWAAQNEAWKFTPNGNEIVPTFSWKNSANQYIGSSQQISVCPSNNDIYTLTVNYNNCGNNYELTDTIPVNFASDFPLAKNFTQVFCNAAASQPVNLNDYQPNVSINPPSNFNFTYHNSLAEAESGANPQPANIAISGNATYFVRIENKNDPTCFRVAVLKLEFISNSLLTTTVKICDLNGDGIENNYRLSQLNTQLFSPGITGTITYYLSQNDANNNTGAVTTANITSSTQVWVKLKSGSCEKIYGPISVSFSSGPTVNSPVSFSETMCHVKGDGMEPYTFTSISPLITADPNVTIEYFATYNQAYSGTSIPLSSITEGTVKIYARVEDNSGCFSIAEINLTVIFTKVIANSKTAYVCFDGSEDKSFDLSSLSQGMLVDPLTGVEISFYDDYDNAVSGLAMYRIPANQTITGNGNTVTQSYWVRFALSDQCYTVREMVVALYHPEAIKREFKVCDLNNDNTENVNLTQFSGQIVGSQAATVTYFNSQSDAQQNSNAITSATINSTAQFWARIESHGCIESYPITVSLTPVPVVAALITKNQGTKCDNNNDGAEVYDLTKLYNDIYSGTDAVSFNFYLNYDAATDTFLDYVNNPAQFPIDTNTTVYAKVTNTNNCSSVSKIVIITDFYRAIKLNQDAVLKKCDIDFNLQEKFDLTEATSQIFNQSQNSVQLSNITITYHATEIEANAGTPQINFIQTTLQSQIIVWARFTNNSGCYSVAPILLKTYLPPKAINSSITVCDSNLDGNYEVDLTAYQTQMVNLVDPENMFSYYLTQANARAGTNAIANPSNYTANPFPAQIWVRVENIPGCMDTASITFNFGTKISLLNAGPFNLNNVCDTGNDGAETLNLTQFENQIENSGATLQYFSSLSDMNNGLNAIANPTNYAFNATASNIIYVKVSKTGFCPNFTTINVSLKPTPMFSMDDTYFCPYNNGSVDIQPNFSGLNIASYKWISPSGKVLSTSNQLLDVNVAGTYTIEVIATNGCPFTTTFNVKAYEVPVITQLVPNGNSYTVIATGSQPILYSINGTTWQTSNIFNNLPVGVTTFYVRFDGSDCLGLTKQGLMLSLNNAITPNGDGYNDTWYVKNLNVFEGQNASLQIFDRYGKMVFEQNSATELIWDGKIQGRPLPTQSYWYVLKLPDGRNFNNWILLKNRE